MSNPSLKPNLVFVFGDQWRSQATGYAGDPNARTPHLDALAQESINFTRAVAGCPVCSPYRASLLTGQYPLTHGVFLNDLCLGTAAVSIAEAFGNEGYDTAYIGKWHVDGHGRSNFIPRERRQGFDFWKVLECTHDYNHSPYYGDEEVRLEWEGYDAASQTAEACRYLRAHSSSEKPFVLFLSWGPPHAPYDTAPERFREMYRPEDLELRPNVPADHQAKARRDLAGYYAHIAALDDCIGELRTALQETGLEENTLFVFTSDHGDMLGSQGEYKKQRPWDESILVPLLLRCPSVLGPEGWETDMLLNAPDIMPTLLGICGVPIPETAEGVDHSAALRAEVHPCAAEDDAALIACYAPFGQYTAKEGGKEYRGIRNEQYTYVRDRKGPWLLYDNRTDPYQLKNVCGEPGYAEEQERLDQILDQKLAEMNDAFLPGSDYVAQWGYEVDETGTVPYTN